MKPPAFKYARPRSSESVMEMLDQYGDDAKVLAGGQSLIPMMNLRLLAPSVLIDVGKLSTLDYIETDNGGNLRIGALTRQATLQRSAEVAANAPLIAQAMRWVSHPAVRARGTVGGSVAHNHPAAELPAVLVALGAEVVVASKARGQRRVSAADLFVSYMATSLADDELLLEVSLPPRDAASRSSFQEVARRHGDFAISAVAVQLRENADRQVEDAAVVLCGVSDSPVRATAADEALIGTTLGDEQAAEAAAALAVRDLEPVSDVHASAAYRRRVSAELVRRALIAAAAPAEVTA